MPTPLNEEDGGTSQAVDATMMPATTVDSSTQHIPPMTSPNKNTEVNDAVSESAQTVTETPPPKSARAISPETPAVVAAAAVDPAPAGDSRRLGHHRKINEHPLQSYLEVDMVLGNYVAEGGFCSIWEVPRIKDTKSGAWILAPLANSASPTDAHETPPKTSRNQHHRKGSSAFGSLGTLAAGFTSASPRHHKRGASSPVTPKNSDASSLLPPAMKSVELTVVRDFNDTENSSTENVSKSTKETNISLNKGNTKNSKDNITLGTSASMQGASYVLKCIKPKSFKKKEVLELALKDMKIEIDMLQQLNHPHIISLKAYGQMEMEMYSSYQATRVAAANTMTNSGNSKKEAIQRYPFIILDRLGETLNDKLQAWESKHKKMSSVVGKMLIHRKHSKATFCSSERMTVLCDLSSALEYMHRRKIVYRDIKPENIGFDRQQNQLKLLDFGLAKDLSNLKASAAGLYRLTVLTGSARFMAPEVAREDLYNESCDIYGLAIVIWQVMALETPYAKFNVAKMFQQVYDCPHVRPSLSQWADADDTSQDFKWLVKLLTKMWSPLIEDRPPIKKVHAILNNQFLKQQQQVKEEDD